jgi:CheY-like chemotaxis protein
VEPFRIVCVEDDTDLARLIQLSLRQWPVSFHVAYDGLRGWQLIQECRPDLILLDLNLPGISGFEIYEYLQDDPDLAAIPVIIMTALPPELHDFSMSRAVAYIVKPFTPHSLREILQPFLVVT